MSNERKPDTDVLAHTPPSQSNPEAALRPSLEVARRRLGGRADVSSEGSPGSLVEIVVRSPAGQKRRLGVLLWAGARYSDIWFEDGVARRAAPGVVCPYAGPVPPDLLRVAAEMQIFLAMREGDRVRWQRPSGVGEGRIVEKCRYGAIVVASDGKVVALGFRKLWPASARAHS